MIFTSDFLLQSASSGYGFRFHADWFALSSLLYLGFSTIFSRISYNAKKKAATKQCASESVQCSAVALKGTKEITRLDTMAYESMVLILNQMAFIHPRYKSCMSTQVLT